MDAGFVVDAVAEFLTWLGLGAAALFGLAALIAKLADGTWLPVRAVIVEGDDEPVLRWFGDDGVHEAPLTPEIESAAEKDEVSVFHRVGSADRVRLESHSHWPRLVGGVAAACGAIGVAALVTQLVRLFTSG